MESGCDPLGEFEHRIREGAKLASQEKHRIVFWVTVVQLGSLLYVCVCMCV